MIGLEVNHGLAHRQAVAIERGGKSSGPETSCSLLVVHLATACECCWERWWMCLVIICYQDAVRHLLSNHIASLIFEREDDLEPFFLALVATVTRDAHRGCDLHRSLRWRVWLLVLLADMSTFVLHRHATQRLTVRRAWRSLLARLRRFER